jgi:hypothetical protein
MKQHHTPLRRALTCVVATIIAAAPMCAKASSHMDAPLITLDPAANTTDVYAFVSTRNNTKYLTTALAVYPFEEPGIGPNKYNFDDNVLYQIHVATGSDLAKGKATHSYQFRFKTSFKTTATIAQSYLGVVEQVDDANQNLTQRYTVTKVNRKKRVLLADAVVPPNNQGLVTKYYNQGDSGENPAREGVASPAGLDRYTAAGIHTTADGYMAFAGQRDDGFYADIQSIFDLDFSFGGPNKPFDSQGGFNVHTIVLNIPVAELGGDLQSVGVWATTSRQRLTVLRSTRAPQHVAQFVQVGRQGNPLFCEAFVPIAQKDAYNRQTPAGDTKSFQSFALNPELGAILGLPEAQRTNRTDLAGIFIPDYIKVDLSTGPARLAGGTAPGAAPNDAGFHRLGIFGGDVLTSTIQPGFGNGAVPGGWPNGRRFGDDVVDIAVVALLSDLRTNPPTVFDPDGQGPLTSADANVDRVAGNEIGYNKVFPYAATPLNGRNHRHHGQPEAPAN